MDWTKFIPIGASLLGGMFGGDKTETTSPQNSPELEAAAKAIFERAMGVFGKPYPQYQGDRVAKPTASRKQLDDFMPSLTSSVTGAMGQNAKYGAQIDKMMGMAPSRISVPTLTGNSVQSTTQGGYYGGAGGGAAGGAAGGDGAWEGFDPAAFAKAAMPSRDFDLSRVAFAPGAK